MLEASAVIECLCYVCGKHPAEPLIVCLAKHIEGSGSGSRTKEAVDRGGVRIMIGLVEELNKLAKRLMDEK